MGGAPGPISARGQAARRIAASAAAACLLVALPSAFSRAASPLTRFPSAEELVARGMPLSAARVLESLPAASRGKSSVLPVLIRKLGEAGHDGAAIALFEKTKGELVEPVRSEAYLALGKLHWARGEYALARRAFREASGTPGAASDAALHLARLYAAEGDVAAAGKSLGAAAKGRKRDAVAAKIGRVGAAYSRDPGGTAPSPGASSSPSGRMSALAERARAALSAADAEGALDAARDGLAAAAAWSRAARALPPWDGTRAGAEAAWAAMVDLFPDKADAGAFLGAGGRFLASAALADTGVAARNGCAELARRVDRAKSALLAARDGIDAKLARAGEIRALALARRENALAAQGRLGAALDGLSLGAWGAGTEPGAAALLEDVDREVEMLRARLDRALALFDERTRSNWSPPLEPEDRLAVFLTQVRLGRIADILPALEGRAAFLKAAAVNRWKAAAASRASALRDRAERAAGAGDALASRAAATVGSLRAAREELGAWIGAVDAAQERLARTAGALGRNADSARAFAGKAHEEAGRRLAQAVAREERAMRYLAARAATGRLLAVPDRRHGLSPVDRAALRAEARDHWGAAAPSAENGGPYVDEALYAVAEIAYDEEEARVHGAAGVTGAADYRRPAALFDRLIVEYPASPYAEPARYGLALALEQAGDPDGSAETLEALLARSPSTRYAAEASLRLGEHLFRRGDYAGAETRYRNVGGGAPPAVRAAATVKLGWALYLSGRPREALEPFLDALSGSDEGAAGIRGESLRMAAHAFVEARLEEQAVPLAGRRGAGAHGPALLAAIMEILDGQNRYEDVAAAADRFGEAYPLDARRVEAESAAALALRKAGRADDGFRRQARFLELFGAGGRWRKAAGRTPADAGRAEEATEKALREAAFHFHARSRETPGSARAAPAREEALALYDAYLAAFPAVPRGAEVAYYRAWLLYEDGRKAAAGAAFETVAAAGGPREEAARYMALQCAKDAAPGEGPREGGEAALEPWALVVRLCDAYERAFPEGPRLADVLLDRARAFYRTGRHEAAAADAGRAAAKAASPAARSFALRIEGEAHFEAGAYADAEKAFRALLASDSGRGARGEIETWIGFSMFRRAEAMPPESAAEASRLFARVADEFPAREIAVTARFRSATSAEQAGDLRAAFAAFLAVESSADPSLAVEATRRLAALDEASGENARAAARYERLAAAEKSPDSKSLLYVRAAGLVSGRDESRARRDYLAAAAVEGGPPDLGIIALYRAGESARAEAKREEADRHYEAAVGAHRAAPGAAPETAANAYLRMAESRFSRYAALAITPPFERSYAAKEASLEECAALYHEAARLGDGETSSAALHRMGEALEAFRDAILAAPMPKGLSKWEREEYALLLEEKAAPLEEKAVESYAGNLRRAARADFRSDWVARSVGRLKALRPARFVPGWEYALPVVASRQVLEEDGDDDAASRHAPFPQPGMEALSRNLAAQAALREGDAPAAERLLAPLAAAGEFPGEVLTNLGLVQAEQGKWREAKENLETAVRARPDLPQTWLNLGLFRDIYLGDPEGAGDCFRRYIELNGPKREEVRKWAERLGRSASPAPSP